MRTLIHNAFDPASRAVRLTLEEKRLAYRLIALDPAALDDVARAQLAAANPAMSLPVLIDETSSGEEASICPATAAIEYLDEIQPDPTLFPHTAAGRAEARRLVSWFLQKFDPETQALATTSDERARADARAAMRWHFDYMQWLLERRAHLACDRLTAADLAAVACISVHDYFGNAPWKDFPEIADWYRRIKCRPSMRAVLLDAHPRRAPALHYHDLDF